MITRVSSKGQIVLPAELRKEDGIAAGQEFEIERIERGEYLLRRKNRRPNEGLVDWLLNCPEKDWLQLSDRSEMTADLKAPKFE